MMLAIRVAKSKRRFWIAAALGPASEAARRKPPACDGEFARDRIGNIDFRRFLLRLRHRSPLPSFAPEFDRLGSPTRESHEA